MIPTQFEMYCSPPGVLTAGLTVSVVAQLAAGSTAGNWKLDLFDYFETRTWVNFGDLTGGECRMSHLFARVYTPNALKLFDSGCIELSWVVCVTRVAYVLLLCLLSF